MPCTELQRIRRELQHIIDAEEIELELLAHATGNTARVARSVRNEFVEKLRTILAAHPND